MNEYALPWETGVLCPSASMLPLLLLLEDNFIEYVSFICFSYLVTLQLQTRAVLMPCPCLKEEKENPFNIGGGHKPLPLFSFSLLKSVVPGGNSERKHKG